MHEFLASWHEAALTTLAWFWKALWAFCLGYLVSASIQVFVTRQRMRRTMGGDGPRAVALGTVFGFISSSCSFSALATTRALFAKGAGLVPSLAFLLSSTNLVIELGIVIAIFLGWQFIVGEYVGGVLLILLMVVLVRWTKPGALVQRVRKQLEKDDDEDDDGDAPDWRRKVRSLDGWGQVASKYAMEWMMVWKDVTVGFTVAGVIAAFVPARFFQWLFVGTGSGEAPGFVDTLLHALVGPLAAMFTFIGSMGNIPLAAVLFDNGVSFAGVMAFIFSDLVVLPVLRMNAKYYGWAMALYIAGVFLACIVLAALALHWGFAAAGHLPAQVAEAATPAARFAIDGTFWLNMAGLALTAGFVGLARKTDHPLGLSMAVGEGWTEKVLLALSVLAVLWLIGGVAVGLAMPAG